MTAVSEDATADLRRRVAELERRLEAAVIERDAAVERQTASALVNFRLQNELRAAHERQGASAEILSAIANTHGNADNALQRIAETTQHFFNAASVTIRITDGKEWNRTIRVGEGSGRIVAAVPASELTIDGKNVAGLVYRENRQIHVPDLDHVDASIADFPGFAPARAGGSRTVSGTPLRRGAGAIGAMIIHRDRLAPFTPEELALQQTFADQAVIAIENARLFNETREALERQTATADILKVIASSPSDVQPVFEAIVNSAAELFAPYTVTITTLKDGKLHWGAIAARGPTYDQARAKSTYPIPFDRERSPSARAILERRIVEILDTESPETPEYTRRVAAAGGFRSVTFVPMVHQGQGIGTIILAHPQPDLRLTASQLALVQTFADQAVIALENTRLFNETQQALERQTATADILKVIASSPSDVQPVFDAIAASANRLIGGFSSSVMLFIDGMAHLKALTSTTPEADEILKSAFPRPVADFPRFRNARIGEIEQITDTEIMPDELRDLARARGYHSVVFAPLEHKGALIGLIGVTRVQPGPFSEHHLQLLKTFADQAVIAIENTRLFNEVQARTVELTEALTYQTGSANILSVIASSPTDVEPVLKAIVDSACELCEAYDAIVILKDGEELQISAHHGPIPMNRQRWANDRTSTSGRSMADRQPVHVHDILSDEGLEFETGRRMSRVDGCRTLLSVPLLREGEAIGAIVLRRFEVHPFSDKQIGLLQTFADQAVIAIGNVQLFEEVQAKTRDLTEALTYQTGSANILKVIASSPTNVGPVLQAIVDSACELCEAYDAVVMLKDGDDLRFSAHHGPIPVSFATHPINRKWTAGRAFIDKKAVHVHDLQAEKDEFPDGQELAATMGHRTIVSVPLLREGESIGVIVLRRTEVHPFSDKQIALLQTFADQAVIALGNVRLFEEVQARTREVSESLQQQTAVGDVLKIISRSTFDLQPVLDIVVETAGRLCDAEMAFILRRDGDVYRAGAAVGFATDYIEFLKKNPIRPDRGTVTGRAVLERRAVHILDVETDPEYTMRESTTLASQHTALGVPLLRENEPIGALVLARQRIEPFTQKQIDLVTTFADQAVIAIENVRLFDQLRQRTDDLGESLQQQTATSEVLQIISSSPSDLAPVFEKMLENATRVCGAEFGSMVLVEGDTFRQAALHNAPAAFAAVRTDGILQIHPQSAMAAAIRGRQVVQVEDVRNHPGYLERSPMSVQLVELGGARTIVVVPMLREDEVIGAITVYRQEVRRFGEKQIDLLRNFARQAVIAIENARLLRELRQRTNDLSESLQFQTASAEVLKVISRSPDTLQPVLDVIVETSRELCNALTSVIFLLRDGKFHHAADSVDHSFRKPEYIEAFRTNPISPDQMGSILARATREKRTVDIPNTEEDFEAGLGGPMDSGGPKALLCVPLALDGRIIGAITLRQSHLTPFTPRQIEAVETFADQAVIAISNVNLFEQVQQRTRELAQSLEDLRTAQGRLIQTEKLASLGQLTAGIAHEIKNPLNFVNNFSALSVELADELNELLRQTELSDKLRKEVDELTGLLKDNLGKVVQHGKRADSIVKNMLLHSREGSGAHRPADINALVDESLNLAYHGARAEKPQFNVTLQRNFDPEAGMIEVFPQEITRVFLNLISNGFYAVTKRKADNGGADFEPVVSATTKGRTDHVEVRIRDNGTGIPPEVKEKMFNPFFTTKPAGEGTGLGLSMSHDIIVKQHGGTIDVDTLQGEFTEFTIVLPRSKK